MKRCLEIIQRLVKEEEDAATAAHVRVDFRQEIVHRVKANTFRIAWSEIEKDEI